MSAATLPAHTELRERLTKISPDLCLDVVWLLGQAGEAVHLLVWLRDVPHRGREISYLLSAPRAANAAERRIEEAAKEMLS
jgi:hypothetical protein